MVILRPVKGLGILKPLRKLGSRLLRPGKIPVKTLFFAMFVCFRKRLIALGIASIYFSDSGRKVKSGFSLCCNSFLNGLILDGFLATILIGLGTD